MCRKICNYLLVSLLLTLSLNVFSQFSVEYQEAESFYKKAVELYDKTQYGSAQQYFNKTIQNIDNKKSGIRISSEYYYAICAVHLFNDNAEELIYDFINKHPENPNINYMYFHLGKFQYSKKQLRKVLHSFAKVDVLDLNEDEKTEYYFKYAYANFKNDNYEEAKNQFFRILNKESKYKSSTTYYYSHIAYSEGNYQTALKGFLSLQENKTFKAVIPYYITHIYYLMEDYNELLKVAPSLYEVSTPKRKPEIARLLGEAYYRGENYKRALPYLLEYHEHAGLRATAAEEYQLAYSYYKLENFDKAIEHFQNIANGADSLAQYANFHLSDCYINVGKKKFALTSLKLAWQIDYDADITENALYNFAKISYELSYNPYNQAIKAFQKYIADYPESERREEVMEYLSKMFLSTRSYDLALESIKDINNRSLELNKAYQRILYLKGVELFNSTKYKEAIPYFEQAISNSYNNDFAAKAKYWMGEAHYRTEDYSNSIAAYKSFLTSAGAFNQSFYSKAYYNIGYAYFKQHKYSDALSNFRLYLQNIDESQTQYLNDANLRIADCYFITKELEKSIEYYNLAIENKSQNSDYALFKKAEALGGLLQYDSKASSLQKLLRLYPNSKYSGSTTYELASTYFKNLNSKNEALVYYKNLIKDYPKDRIYVKKAMLDIGLLYNNMGQTEDAINSFKEFIAYYKGTKESKDALKMLQSIYIETNRADEYLAYAKDLGVNIAITEQDSILYYSVENTYMHGDCEKAIKGFNDYLNRFETGAFVSSANYFLGDCYFKSSAFDKALMHFENVAEMPVSGFTEDALSKMAYIYYHKKYDYEKALAAYKRLKNSTEYKNTERQAKLGILNSEYKLNNYAEVFSAADAVLNMENPEKRHRTLAFMLKAKSALALGYDSLAKESFTNVVFSTNSEESAEARYNLAYIAYKGEEYDKAESYIFDIIEQDPSYEYWVAKAFILSADIFVDTDNRHQAKATLQSIVDNYKGDQALIKEAQDKLDAINERIRQEKENIKDETPVEVNFSEEDLMLFDIEKQESELELEEEIR